MARKAKTYKFTEATIESIRIKLEDLNQGKRVRDEDEISETAFLEMLINNFDVDKYLATNAEGENVSNESSENEVTLENEVQVNLDKLETKIEKITEILEKADFLKMVELLKDVSRDITLNTDWIKIDLATHIDLHKVERDPNLRKRLVYDIKDYPRLKNIIAREVIKLKEEDKNNDDKAGNTEK